MDPGGGQRDFLERGRDLVEQRAFADAVKVLRLGLLRTPAHVAARILLARALAAGGRYDEALRELRVALDHDPRSTEGWLLRGEILGLQGNFDQAEEALQRAHDIDSSSVYLRRLLDEVRTAKRAGLHGLPHEPTFTREYPALAQIASEGPQPLRRPCNVAVEETTDRDATTAAKPLATRPEEFPGDATLVDPVEEISTGELLLPTDPGRAVAAAPPDHSPSTSPSRSNAGSPPESASQSPIPSPNELTAETPTEPRARLYEASAGVELGEGDLSEPPQPATPQRRTRPERPVPLVIHPVPRPAIAPAERLAPTPLPPTSLIELPQPLPTPSSRPTIRRWLTTGAILVASLFVVVLALGAIIRSCQTDTQIAHYREQAQKELARGTYASHLQALADYSHILALRRSSQPARLGRAHVLAAMAFEFGESIEDAAREVSSLGDDTDEEAAVARTYLALAREDSEKAKRLAGELDESSPGPISHYLSARSALLVGDPDRAARILANMIEAEAQSPLALHALALAEIARHRDHAAFDALRRCLTKFPRHPPTLLTLARLEARRGQRLSALASLDRLVSELVTEASPLELASAYLELARIRLDEGRLASALAMLARVRDKYKSDHLQLSEGLAAAYLEAGEWDRAEAEARRALTHPHPSTAARLILARVALARGQAKLALDLLDPLDVDQLDVDRWHALARLAGGDALGARKEIEQRLRQQPARLDLRLALAQTMLAQGQASQVVAQLEPLARREKGSSALADLLASALQTLGRIDRARFWYERAITLRPILADAHLSLARLERRTGRTAEALKRLQRAVEIIPNSPALRGELGDLLFYLGEVTAARDEYEAILREHTDDARALLGLAQVRLDLGDAAGTREALLRAEKTAANSDELIDVKARLLLRQQHAKAAAALLRPRMTHCERAATAALFLLASTRSGSSVDGALALVPVALRRTPEVLLAEARATLPGRPTRAETLVLPLLSRRHGRFLPAPLRAEAQAIVGASYLARHSLPSAERWLSMALRQNPRHAEAQLALGLVLDEKGQPQGAIRAIDKALGVDPLLADAHFHLGRICARLGDQRALLHLRTYLEAVPQGAHAREAQRLLYRLRRSR